MVTKKTILVCSCLIVYMQKSYFRTLSYIHLLSDTTLWFLLHIRYLKFEMNVGHLIYFWYPIFKTLILTQDPPLEGIACGLTQDSSPKAPHPRLLTKDHRIKEWPFYFSFWVFLTFFVMLCTWSIHALLFCIFIYLHFQMPIIWFWCKEYKLPS